MAPLTRFAQSFATMAFFVILVSFVGACLRHVGATDGEDYLFHLGFFWAKNGIWMLAVALGAGLFWRPFRR